jgi:hypothetical protein
MFNIPTVTVAKTTLEAAAETVTLTYVAPSVSWTPMHLVIRWSARSNEEVDVERGVSLRLNEDTGTNYNDQRLDGAVEAETAGRTTDATNIASIGVDTGDSSAAYGWSSGEFILPDALSTRTHKSVIGFSGAIEQRVRIGAGRWANTAAITSISLSQEGDGAFLAGSTFELCVVDESFNVSETILASNSSSAGFAITGISAANGDLVCIGTLRSTRSDNADSVRTRLNGDTTDTNYNTQRMFGDANTAGTSSQNLSQNAVCTAASSEANSFGAYVNQISNFSDGANDRVQMCLNGFHEGDTPRSYSSLEITHWNNTAAVTAVQLYCNGYSFVTGSMLSIYAVPKNLIARQELGGTTTSVTFSDIPQTYDHLELSTYARAVGTAVGARAVSIDVNADSTATNYSTQTNYGEGTGIVAYQADNQHLTTIPAQTATANHFGGGTHTFYNYTKTDRHKHYLSSGGLETSSISLISARWENTDAITSLVVKCNADDFVAGSVFELRGINADIAPVAGSASAIEKLNGIAATDIEAIN